MFNVSTSYKVQAKTRKGGQVAKFLEKEAKTYKFKKNKNTENKSYFVDIIRGHITFIFTIPTSELDCCNYKTRKNSQCYVWVDSGLSQVKL